MTLIYLSIAWVTGIYSGSKIALSPGIICLGLLPLCLIPFFRAYKGHLLLAAFCIITFLGGCVRFQSSLPPVDEHQLQFYNDSGTVTIEGMVCIEPEPGNKSSTLQISATRITTNDKLEEIEGKALVHVPRYQEYHYGDVLKVTGKLETPPQFENFDYRSYLARQGIFSIINYPQIEVIDTGCGFKPLTWIYSLRNRLWQSLSLALPEPQASLAQGILLGLRGNISDTLNETFAKTGTAHLLAISGLHLSIIIGMLLSTAIWIFGKQHSIHVWLAFLTIWLYATLAGLRAPIVRGAIMGSLFLTAEYLGRQRSALTALGFAAAVMVGIEPQVLWSASFQLSFLAMGGLIFLFPRFQAMGRKALSSATRTEGATASLLSFMVDGLAVTSAAIIATWPVIAYHFGIVSLVSLPATFFAMLALPGIIITTAITSVVGLFTPLLAQILGWVAWLFLSYFILVVKSFEAIPFSFLELGNMHLWQIWVYYALIVATVTAINYRKQLAYFLSGTVTNMRRAISKAKERASGLPKKWVITPLLIVNVLIWTAMLSMPNEKLHVSILNVGQGDAILIQTPGQQDILIDGGPDPQAVCMELGKKLPFWDRTIDLVVLTQPQADHVAGLIEVLQRYKVTHAMESGLSSSSTAYQRWLSVVKDKRIEYKVAHAGQTIELGSGILMEVLHPPSPWLQGTSDDIDNNGLVLRLSWDKISFLFTADIGKEAELYLIAQRAKLKSTVLKVAHHGSQTSTSSEFLAVVDPEIAVISVGARNRFGLPDAEVVTRLIQRLGSDRVYSTPAHGSIEFITDGEKLWLQTDRHPTEIRQPE